MAELDATKSAKVGWGAAGWDVAFRGTYAIPPRVGLGHMFEGAAGRGWPHSAGSESWERTFRALNNTVVVIGSGATCRGLEPAERRTHEQRRRRRRGGRGEEGGRGEHARGGGVRVLFVEFS